MIGRHNAQPATLTYLAKSGWAHSEDGQMVPERMLAKRPDGAIALPDHIKLLIRELDRRRRGRFGILLGGQSPWAVLQAWEDWTFHLMLSSAKQIELCELALQSASSLYGGLLGGEAQICDSGTDSEDRRFRDPGWKRPPFSILARGQMAAEAQ